MAFIQKHSSPFKQGLDLKDLRKPIDKKMMSNMQSSLDSSNKKVSKIKEDKKANPHPGGIVKVAYDDLDSMHPLAKTGVQILDPTGVSSYRDVRRVWNDGKSDENDILEPLGALPAVGAFGKVIKGLKVNTDIFKEYKASKALRKVNKFSDIETGFNATTSSPLHKQKLSPKAAKAKAERDLAYAKTPDRRAKKAEDQRRHRHDPKGKGKDWDHEDQRWEDPHQNRGNDGNGTKSERGKKYKITKAR